MIRLTKKTRRSFHIELDKMGVSDLINHLSDNSFNVNIIHHKLKKLIIIISEEANDIIIDDQLVKLELDNDEKDFFLQRLYCCVQNNSFYPAELCERDMKNETVSIYVVYIEV